MRWALLAFCLLASSAYAQTYPEPERRVRHIIPWGAGGATDTAMRGFMQYFEKHLGVPVITENIPGGLSAVGLIRLKTARPDGYTIGTLTYDVLTLSVQGLAPVGWEDFELIGTVTISLGICPAFGDRVQVVPYPISVLPDRLQRVTICG